MNKIFASLAIAIATIAGTPATHASETLRIATEGAYPPFNQLEPDGSLSGFDVDIAKAVCADIKATCTFVKQDFDGLIPGLLAKKYDLIAASMTITDERKKKVDFSEKYYQASSQFAAKKGAGLDVTPDGLKDKIIGVQRATIQACLIQKFFSKSDIKLYPTNVELISDLRAGRIDVAFSETLGFSEQLFKGSDGANYELVGQPQKDPECLGKGIGFALRKNNDELREKLSSAIQHIRADGTYAKINAKYFPFDIYGD
jgi:lysine-arginine-ornithine-binding protein